MENKIKVYLKHSCPFCIKVKNYLESENIGFEEIDVLAQPEAYEVLKQETHHPTVPQVFINDKFIGGADDFFTHIKDNPLK